MTSCHCSRGHLVERCVAGDACVSDNHVDRAKVSFDLSDTGGAFFIAANVPLVRLDAGLGSEGGSFLFVASKGRGDLVSFSFQRF